MDQIQEKILAQSWFDKWHVFAAWLYLIIVGFDFLFGPIFNNLFAFYNHSPMNTWQPITLQGGSMFHISMTAIIGISSYGKSQQLVETIKNMPDYSSTPLISPENGEAENLPASHRGNGKG